MNFLTKIKSLKKNIKEIDNLLEGKDFLRVSDVKKALEVSTSTAKELLEVAVISGYLKKEVLIYSPILNVVIQRYSNENEVDDIVYDDEHEEDDNYAFIKKKHSDRFMEVVYRYE